MTDTTLLDAEQLTFVGGTEMIILFNCDANIAQSRFQGTLGTLGGVLIDLTCC